MSVSETAIPSVLLILSLITLPYLFPRVQVIDEGDRAVAVTVDSDAEDEDDDEIRPTDSLFVAAITEDEDSHLEVQLYSEDGNLYVHHDIYLPEFPLCVAWLDCPPYRVDGGQMKMGNYLAVGTFAPAIEIWNLDVLDPLEPSAILGGEDPSASSSGKKKKKKREKMQFLPGSHTEGVMSMSWNKTYRQVLSSGSADQSVKIWDVTTQQCSFTFNHHTDKVCGNCF